MLPVVFPVLCSALVVAAPPAKVQTVLVMPIAALGNVEEDLAVQVTSVLVAEVGKVPGFSVQSYRELQGALSQEQLKQASGCDSVGCAAELAGALNTDQIIIGNLGRVGKSYLLTLSRITAAAQTVGRTVTKVPRGDEEALVDGMPGVTAELMGVNAAREAKEPAKEPVKEAPPPPRENAGPKKKEITLKKPPRAGQLVDSEWGTQPFAWIPAGTAMLGCGGKEKCSDDDAPAHQASFGGFWLMRTEVTVQSYQACVAAGVCRDPGPTRDTPLLGCNLAHGRGTHPANCVTFNEAQKYCDWEGGRLPNSDEWEYAARGGKAARFPFGNALTGQRANFCDRQCHQARALKRKALRTGDREAEKAAEKDMAMDDGYAMTAPVGSYPQGVNPWGLLDMAGNVREWSFTTTEPPQKNTLKGVPGQLLGLIPTGNTGPEHEVLGGGWMSRSTALVVHARDVSPATAWNHTLGFRCLKMTPRLDKTAN